jgi:hypothetical protein
MDQETLPFVIGGGAAGKSSLIRSVGGCGRMLHRSEDRTNEGVFYTWSQSLREGSVSEDAG